MTIWFKKMKAIMHLLKLGMQIGKTTKESIHSMTQILKMRKIKSKHFLKTIQILTMMLIKVFNLEITPILEDSILTKLLRCL